VHVYRLTRDDGVELRLNGCTWESALELAFLYGWIPKGTETPLTGAWQGLTSSPGTTAWDSHDYFSHESQHVGRDDARALAEAVFRALQRLPDPASGGEGRPSTVGAAPPSSIPSQESATAAGLSFHRRNAVRRFAAFADRGGFVIGLVL